MSESSRAPVLPRADERTDTRVDAIVDVNVDVNVNMPPFPLILAIFFMSGITGLVYQVVWVKLLGLTFGVTAFAVSAVLGAFFAGLALGSFVAGKWIERQRSPLRVYAVLEFLIGIYALALPLVFQQLTPLYQALYQPFRESEVLLVVVRFVLAFVMLVLPTTLMGATLPVLAQTVVQSQKELGARTARLYSWNTVGAVAGSLLAGFLLIGLFGLRATTLFAAVLNFLAGIAALWLAQRQIRSAPPRTVVTPRSKQPSSALARAALVVMFLSGFAALGFEVIWTRLLTTVSDFSTFAFSAMVASVLVGIAAGSAWIGRTRWITTDPARALWVAEIALAVTALVSPLLIVLGAAPYLQLDAAVAESNSLNYFVSAVAFIALTLFSLLPASFCMGVTFPLAASLYARERGRVGESVGETYAANVIGATLGSIVTGFVLLPQLGSQATLFLLAALNLLGAGVLVWSQRRRVVWAGLGVAVAVLAICAFVLPSWFYPAIMGVRYPRQQILDLREGIETTVIVTQVDGVRNMAMNGYLQATTDSQVVAVHHFLGALPTLLHPTPEDVLIIGMGGGATPGVVAQSAKHLELVEISPEVVRAGDWFTEINFDLTHRPNVQVRIADGRNALLLTDAKYDLIEADVIHALHASSGNLYSVEYYSLIAAHLKPGGIMTQWVDSSLLEYEQAIIKRTFAQAFPHVQHWTNGSLSILIGSNDPITPDAARIAARWTPEMAAEYKIINVTSSAQLYADFDVADDALRTTIGAGAVITDDHPYNEYFRLWRLMNALQKRFLPNATPFLR